jgi:hypothetical protein
MSISDSSLSVQSTIVFALGGLDVNLIKILKINEGIYMFKEFKNSDICNRI